MRDEQPGLTVEADGPLVRVAGQVRGFVGGPRDLGVGEAGLDALIARQREYFAALTAPGNWISRGLRRRRCRTRTWCDPVIIIRRIPGFA
jgi:hypothetical protein